MDKILIGMGNNFQNFHKNGKGIWRVLSNEGGLLSVDLRLETFGEVFPQIMPGTPIRVEVENSTGMVGWCFGIFTCTESHEYNSYDNYPSASGLGFAGRIGVSRVNVFISDKDVISGVPDFYHFGPASVLFIK